MVSAIKYQTLKKIIRRHYKNKDKPKFVWSSNDECHMGMRLKNTNTRYKVSLVKKKADITLEVVKYG